jgi:Holliday junction resolvase RusA-like endonuclease
VAECYHFEVRVDGIPKGQPRPRAFAFKGHARIYDAGTAEGWKSQVADAVKRYLPPVRLEGPVRVTIEFYFPRPKRLCRKCDPLGRLRHIAKPDADNCVKAVLDALQVLGLYRNDGQVCLGPIDKWYHAIGGRPGAWISVQDLTGTAPPAG